MFKKAIEFNYSNTYVDLNNGIDLLKSKKFIECLEYFEKVLVVEPNNLEAYYNKVITIVFNFNFIQIFFYYNYPI